jgi:alanyl-tRNA synthetase
MKSSQIRQEFLDFFAGKGHTVVASSTLVPVGDPTLLFTNAGMNQFKDVFLGFERRPYTRAASSQKCVRAGGKHNDLENVGYTARHHTFFEMLGNFSFGDYFKRDAIAYAWELLTRVFQLPVDRLLVTVYAEDEEAWEIWRDVAGLPPDRIIRIGDNKGARHASDNFWMMGDTGPCGPCSEIFYDHGPQVAGGPPGSAEEDGDRYVEIWNNVFMQYNRDEAGVLHPLPRPSVDTGMGLERIAAVLQGVHSNYDIDIFRRLIAAAARETGCSEQGSASLRVIADHIRASAFIVSDGVIPGNEGRGYVLRRIVRRAIRHGYKLGARSAFFHRLVPDLVAEMGEAYPELAADAARVSDVLRQEEERFFATLANGMEILEEAIARGDIDGGTAFRLHDTYGFPLDLTADVCRERGVRVDEAGFAEAMSRQRAQARASGTFRMACNLEYGGPSTAFHGYERLDSETRVIALYRDGSAVEALHESETGVVVLDATPFYAESGGQVGDRGLLRGPDGLFDVEDTQKVQAAVFGHHGVVSTGALRVGDLVRARVDAASRTATMRNHSATHLMHKALREVLGPHVQQKGSLVDADKTRFDFSHNQAVTAEQIEEVERRVNAEILANAPTQARVMAIAEAQKSGAVMLFGERYGDEVRVLDIGSSRELCGGTHVARTGDIGLFRIYAESGVAAGVRRVEAATGEAALALSARAERELGRIAAMVKVAPEQAAARIESILEHGRAVEKELAALKARLAATAGDTLAAQAVEVSGSRVLAATLDGADANALREAVDRLRDTLKSAVVVLASVDAGKVVLIAGVTADLTQWVKAGELVSFVAAQVGGRGGGRPDMAQAGGSRPDQLPTALRSVPDWVGQRLQG